MDKASYLTEPERELAASRLLVDKPVTHDPSGNVVLLAEPFTRSACLRAVFSLKTWLSATAYFGILAALYSFGLFVPTIVQSLGYTAVRAQLFSVPPYAVAAVLTVVAAYASDRLKTRGPIMLAFLPLSIIGYAVIGHSDSNNVKYGMLFMMAAGLYTSVPPVLVWLSNNYSDHYSRATAIALQLAIANCGGFVASNTYADGPSFSMSHTIIMGLLIAAWVLIAIKCVYLWFLNRRKATGGFDQYKGCGDDRDPAFRYVI